MKGQPRGVGIGCGGPAGNGMNIDFDDGLLHVVKSHEEMMAWFERMTAKAEQEMADARWKQTRPRPVQSGGI